MGSSIDVLSLASFASLAIATNASYLNLPYFRYRKAISDRASPTFKQYKNIDNNNLVNLKEFKLLRELSGMEGNSHPAGKNPGSLDDVEWECEEGRVYLKTFHEHQDKRISTAALWMSGSYLSLSTFSDVSDDPIIVATVSLYILTVSLLTFGLTYLCCNFSQQARFISVVRKRNLKMLCPATVLFLGLSGILFGELLFSEIQTVSILSNEWHQSVYIFVGGKLSLICAIAAMIYAIFYPLNLIRLGNQVVDRAEHTIDECDASLSPYLEEAKKQIETALGGVSPVTRPLGSPQGDASRKSPTSASGNARQENRAMSKNKPDNDDSDQEKKAGDDIQVGKETGD